VAQQRRERDLIADCDNRKLYAQQLLCQQIGRDLEQRLMECLEERDGMGTTTGEHCGRD